MRIAPAAASARAAAAASAGDALGSSSKSSRGGMGFSLQRKRRWQPEMLRSSTWLTQTSHRHPQNCLSTALPPSTFLGEGGAPPTRLLRTCRFVEFKARATQELMNPLLETCLDAKNLAAQAKSAVEQTVALALGPSRSTAPRRRSTPVQSLQDRQQKKTWQFQCICFAKLLVF